MHGWTFGHHHDHYYYYHYYYHRIPASLHMPGVCLRNGFCLAALSCHTQLCGRSTGRWAVRLVSNRERKEKKNKTARVWEPPGLFQPQTDLSVRKPPELRAAYSTACCQLACANGTKVVVQKPYRIRPARIANAIARTASSWKTTMNRVRASLSIELGPPAPHHGVCPRTRSANVQSLFGPIVPPNQVTSGPQVYLGTQASA